jgi:hypothetical protein
MEGLADRLVFAATVGVLLYVILRVAALQFTDPKPPLALPEPELLPAARSAVAGWSAAHAALAAEVASAKAAKVN